MSLRNAIQQYGAIAETLTHAFLSFAPVAAGPGDIETERIFQLVQSISDLVALRRDKYLQPGATNVEVCTDTIFSSLIRYRVLSSFFEL
jgi:hypothetical protein